MLSCHLNFQSSRTQMRTHTHAYSEHSLHCQIFTTNWQIHSRCTWKTENIPIYSCFSPRYIIREQSPRGELLHITVLYFCLLTEHPALWNLCLLVRLGLFSHAGSRMQPCDYMTMCVRVWKYAACLRVPDIILPTAEWQQYNIRAASCQTSVDAIMWAELHYHCYNTDCYFIVDLEYVQWPLLCCSDRQNAGRCLQNPQHEVNMQTYKKSTIS